VLSNEVSGGVTTVTPRLLACRPQFLYGKHKVGSLQFRMLYLTNPENSRRGRWSALVVLVAVCALTISVATRYSSGGVPAYGVRTAHRHPAPEPSRQRLTKNTNNWIPPVVRIVVLQAPTSYPRIAPAGPPIPSLVLEKSLYNRPPPSSEFLS